MESFTAEPGVLNRYLANLQRALVELGARASTAVTGSVPFSRRIGEFK